MSGGAGAHRMHTQHGALRRHRRGARKWRPPRPPWPPARRSSDPRLFTGGVSAARPHRARPTPTPGRPRAAGRRREGKAGRGPPAARPCPRCRRCRACAVRGRSGAGRARCGGRGSAIAAVPVVASSPRHARRCRGRAAAAGRVGRRCG